MRSFLPRQFYFLFLLALWSGQLLATPACPIITQSFQNTANGTTVDNSATGWYIDASKLTNPLYFAVKSNRFKAENIGAEGIWYSRVFSVAGYSSFQVAVKITAEGLQTSSEYVKVYYMIDGGAPTLLDQRTGNFGTIDFTSAVLTGSNVQLMVKLYNFNNGSAQTSKYYIEQYRVFKDKGPCSASGISVSATAGNGGVLTCNTSSIALSATTTATGTTTWSWTGPNSFTSTSQNPTVSTAGTYTVVGTNAAGTGSATVTVSSSQAAPNATATGETITCSAPSVTLSGASTTSGVSYSWTGPNGFSSTAQSPSVSVSGVYTLTVTITATGCTASNTANVTLNNTLPVVTATAGSVLTCATTSATLTGNSTPSTGVSYSWTGPNSFTSTAQNPTASTAGIYTLTVTNTATGCVGSDTANLVQNRTLPVVIASANSVLTCTSTSATLTGSSTPSTGVSYSWTGPGSFTSTTQNPTASTAGIYTLTVTNTATGCTGSDTANLIQTTALPVVTASANSVLTCTTASATLTGSSTPSTGVSYSWTGPGSFTSIAQNPTASTAGIYTLTVTNTATGCVGSDTANLLQNKTLPVVTATANGVLTCNSPSTTLSGSFTPSSGVSFGWTGPTGFTSAVQNPTITAGGIYTLTVTNTATGCTGSDTANAIVNTTGPGASATVSGTLNCRDTVVTLSGSSPTAGVSFSWTGPNGFSSTIQNPTVKKGGNYTLTVTSPVNGCTSITGVAVSQDTIHPANMTAAITSAAKQLDCNNNNLFLQGGTTTSGVNYAWTGPNGFSVTALGTMVFSPGVYTFTAVNPTNFCSGSAVITVVQNLTPPANLTAQPVLSQLTCTNTSSTIVASSTTPGVSYAWSGPNGFSSASNSITVAAPGNYTVLLTNPANGCTNNTLVQVSQNITPPANVVASTLSGSTKLTCTNSSQTLSGSAASGNISFAWSGPNGFSATTPAAAASAAGTYLLTATNNTNGCTATASVALQANTVAPTGVTSTSTPGSGLLSCTNTSVQLNGSSSTATVRYNWSGPNNFNATAAAVSVQSPGTYTLTATDTTNGCTATATAVVTQNTASPVGLTATVDQQLTCSVTTVNLAGSSTTPGVNYNWTGPNGYTASTAHTQTAKGGTYTLHVTNPTNGCSQTLPLTVSQNIAPPANVTATNSGPLTCDVTEVTLTGTTSTVNAGFEWDGPNSYQSFSAQDVATDPGNYVLTVTNFDNGCTLLDTTTVQFNCGPARRMTNPSGNANTPANSSDAFTFNVYPNPITDNAFVEFKLPNADFVKVQVYNNTGIVEKLLFSSKVVPNLLYKLTLSGNLPAGVHYFTISVNNKIYTKKIIAVK